VGAVFELLGLLSRDRNRGPLSQPIVHGVALVTLGADSRVNGEKRAEAIVLTLHGPEEEREVEAQRGHSHQQIVATCEHRLQLIERSFRIGYLVKTNDGGKHQTALIRGHSSMVPDLPELAETPHHAEHHRFAGGGVPRDLPLDSVEVRPLELVPKDSARNTRLGSDEVIAKSG
jgi:hypothetical protein